MIRENELFLAAWERASRICDEIVNPEQKGRMREALTSIHFAFEKYVELESGLSREVFKLERKVNDLQKKREKGAK